MADTKIALRIVLITASHWGLDYEIKSSEERRVSLFDLWLTAS
jgi:hypothetical protein